MKRALNLQNGQQVAIKILDKDKIQKQRMGAQIKREITVMKMMHHVRPSPLGFPCVIFPTSALHRLPRFPHRRTLSACMRY